MGYRVVDALAVEPTPDRPSEQRRLTEPAQLEQLSFNRYVVEPGEQMPLVYHYHDTQEEAFYVVSGVLEVETPEKTYRVERDQLFAADPESPHRAYVPPEADVPATVLAVGAPNVSGDAYEYEQ
jgi:mannose-6-phosphate isomerase-like protein (cupin superfamily)